MARGKGKRKRGGGGEDEGGGQGGGRDGGGAGVEGRGEEGRDGFLTKTQITHPRGSPRMRNLSMIVDTRAYKPLKELWDYENIHVPKDLTLDTALENIQNTLIQNGYYILSIEAYAQQKVFSNRVLKKLRSADVQGMIAKEYAGQKREYADLAMMQRIFEWVEEHDPPAPLLVLTADLDFFTLIQNLTRPRYGFDILVASNRSAPEEFNSLPSLMKWEELAAGRLLAGPLIQIPDDQVPPPPPLRRAPPLRRKDKHLLVPVYWDIGTSSIPKDVQPEDVFANLETAVRAMGFRGVYSVTVCSRDGKLDEGTIDILRGSGMTVRSLLPPTTKKKRENMDRKGHPDVELGKAMHLWALERNPSPMLLISSDFRLSDVVSSIHRLEFEIILAHNRDAPPDFTEKASRCFIWSDGAGTGLVTGGLVPPGV